MSRLPLQEEKNCTAGLSYYQSSIVKIQAQAASLTVAQAFNLAFSSWKENQEKKNENGNNSSAAPPLTCCDQPTSCSIKAKRPASREISEEDESLLIDLRSPGDSLEDKTLAATAFLVRLDSKDDNQQEDMDLSFAK